MTPTAVISGPAFSFSINPFNLCCKRARILSALESMIIVLARIAHMSLTRERLSLIKDY